MKKDDELPPTSKGLLQIPFLSSGVEDEAMKFMEAKLCCCAAVLLFGEVIFVNNDSPTPSFFLLYFFL